MPKKSLKINQFHGGLNNYRDKRDTPDNALVNASNVMVDIPGKVRMMGRDMPFEQLANTVDIAGGVTPGYGLFAFKADHDLSGAATNDGNVFVVYQNGNQFNIAQNGIIYDPDTAIEGITAGFTPGWSGALNTVFHYTNERLFVSDANFDNTSNMPYVYEFLDNTLFPTDADHDIKWPAGWYGSSVSYPSMLNDNFEVASNIAPEAPTSTALKFKITADNNTTDTGSYQGDQSTDHFYWFGISSIYYHGEESPILYNTSKYHTFDGPAAGDYGELSLGLQIALDGSYTSTTPDSALDKRIVGFKIYLMADGASSSSPTLRKDPELIATADMNKETIVSHEGNSQSFLRISGVSEANPTIYGNATGLVISTLPTTTFEMENLYSYDVPTVRAKWKTSTVMGNQIFVGNVRRYKDDSVSSANEIPEPDNILRVIPPPLSKRAGIFPSTDFLEVASGDGDEIIKLESFADRIIVLKRNTTYVINISGDIEYIENEFKFAGIASPYNSMATEFGIVWVNPKGAYLYDGEKLTNLIEGKIDPYISPELTADGDQMPGWSNFIGSSGGQLGYLPEEKHLLIFDTPYGNSANVTDANIQGNMMILDLKSGSWTYSTNRISNYSRSNIISGVNKSCLFLGNVSSGSNTITTTILKEGRPYSNFHQELHGITNDQISPANTNYQLLLKDSQGNLTDLTGDFTWNAEEQATSFVDNSQSFANKIATQIMLYNDEYSTNNILAEDISLDSDGFAYKIKVTFTAPDTTGSNGIAPFIFNKEIVWNTAEGYVAPSSSASGVQFFNSGLGCGIAPIRSWYQEEAMTGHSNYTGNIILNEPGELLTELKNTWGGLQNYPYKEIDNSNPSEGPAYYTTFPAFAPRNYIYKWLVNKAALYLGLPQQQFYEDYQLTFGTPDWVADPVPINEEALLKGLPWGSGLFTGYKANNDPYNEIFIAQEELNARNSLTSPLYSYTGFVINPLGGRDMTYSDAENHWSYTTSGDDGQYNIACAARTNPRLVRYMCNFTHNDSLKNYSSESLDMSNGPGYVLPNDINSGAYVSPGLIFTQSWSTDSEDLHAKFVSDGGSNSGEDQKNGNGFYRDNSGSQQDTQWPNGYFYFGFGKDNPNCKIVEGVGKTSSNELINKSDLEVLNYVETPFASDPTMNMRVDSNLYANNYFIGWQTTFNDFSSSLENVQSKAEYFISKDLLDSGSNYLFKDFGDLMYTPGIKYSNPDNIEPFNNIGNGYGYNSSKNYYGFSNSFPDADGIFPNFEDEDKETRVYGNSIPFNQQSPSDALTCEARDNMLTRDSMLFKEPESIGQNGIVFETKISTNGFESDESSSTRPKANHINRNSGLQSIAIMNGDNSKAWEDSTLFYSDAGVGEQVDASGKLPSAVSYSSVPYLVIEVTHSEIILHYICDYTLNKHAHVIGNKYEWSLPATDSPNLNYEFSDMILSGGEVIDVQNNKVVNLSNPWLENDINDDGYEGQIYDPIHNYPWGINGYCKLRFLKSEQLSVSTKQSIELLAAGPGTVAFWNNPLKNENHSAHANGELDTLSTFYPPKAKDTSFDYNIDPRDLTDISGAENGNIESSGAGAVAGFQLFSLGDNGEKREIILHNSRSLSAEQTNPLQANMLITKTDNANSPISKSISDIKWTSGDYDDSYDVNNELKTQISGTAGIFSENPAFVTINGSGSSNYPRITDNFSSATGTEIILKAEDFNVNAGESYTISLQEYIAAGDIIYLSSVNKRYRALTVTYDGNDNSANYGKTTIAIDTNINGTGHGVLTAIDSADTASTESLTCGALHFKDGGSSTIKSDLFISGGYTGELKVLQFNNNSTFADLVDNDSEYPTGGGAFIETKDFDFGNPSSLKNINYVDISAKGTGSLKISYALNNSGNFNRESIDELVTSVPFDDNLNFKTFRFQKVKGSIKNCNSIQLRIEIIDGEGFELNDISIVYREKVL